MRKRNKSASRRLIPYLVLVAIFAFSVCFFQWAQAQTGETPPAVQSAPQPDSTPQTNSTSQPDSEPQPLLDDGSAQEPPAVRDQIFVGNVETTQAIPDDPEEKRFRQFVSKLPRFLRPVRGQAPVMAFRHWARLPKPFGASFAFCLLIGLIGTAFFPNQVAVAQEACRKQFWRCIGRAILVGAVVFLLFRIFTEPAMHIAQPLGMVLLALYEFGLVAGLAVAISLIGERLLTKTKLANLAFFTAHPRVAAFTKILIGSLIIALLVQILNIGVLPRVGIRIAMLCAILGAGGLLKTRFGTQPL